MALNGNIWQGKHLKAHVLFSKAGVAQQVWVSSDKGSILVDAGDGTVRDIISNGLDIRSLKGVVFTHGHYDHIGGIHSLLGFLRCIGRTDVLHIFAPDGCAESSAMVNNFIRCYPGTIAFEIKYQNISDHQKFEISGMEIEAYPMVHRGNVKPFGGLARIPAMGYRISCNGENFAITGDTGVCSSVKDLVKGADLAIIEATFEDSKKTKQEYLENEHLSEDIANEIGKLSKEYVIVHRGKRENIANNENRAR